MPVRVHHILTTMEMDMVRFIVSLIRHHKTMKERENR